MKKKKRKVNFMTSALLNITTALNVKYDELDPEHFEIIRSARADLNRLLKRKEKEL